MPRKKRTRHGATQPEEARANEGLFLRMPPEKIARIRKLAAERGMKVNEYVSSLVP